MRSTIEPMKKVARSLIDKRELFLNWFRAGGTISTGIVEVFNIKLKLITRKSYGFRTQTACETTYITASEHYPKQISLANSARETLFYE